MTLSVRPPLYELPPYSLTGDLLSFQVCPRQYRFHNLGNLPQSRPVQLWFGQFIHGVMEEAYRRFQAGSDPRSEVADIVKLITQRLRAQGLSARSRLLEAIGQKRAEAALRLLGPHLFPLIARAEVRLTGARQMPEIANSIKRDRNADRYELVGVVDVLSNTTLNKVQKSTNLIAAAVRSVLSENSRAAFEVIIDYKGMRRPAQTKRRGRLPLETFQWQLQNYAALRERQQDALPVAAGVLIFMNELHPTQTDWRLLQEESQKGITDVPIESNWRNPSEASTDFLVHRALHVIPVTEASKSRAMGAFDDIVREIEVCRAKEAAGSDILSAWPANADDKATCDACDQRTFCDGYIAKYGGGKRRGPSPPAA